ncbi:MAG: error-prone DNA polymerase [Deltaproteobacteria bacterium]|nr:error-prone DNA polymerase [Deltaproteobacteria bacterium]
MITTPFIELLCKTNFSFLEGASFPSEMVEQARQLGYDTLGVADTNGVYGIPRSFQAARTHNLRLLIGAEIRFSDMALFALARNRNGYGNLCEILSAFHQREMPPALAELPLLFEKSSDLFFFTGTPSEPLLKLPDLHLIASAFFDARQGRALAETAALAEQWHLPVIASNQPLFHTSDRKPLQDVLTCIRNGVTLTKAGFHLLPNSERRLKSPGEMAMIFAEHPEWLSQTQAIADQCRFSLTELRYQYPTEWLPPGETGISYLTTLVGEGLQKRYGDTPGESVLRQTEHELALVRDLQYADYFLTIWDITQFAESQKILFQGRGSAANSIICYVLGITAIDPIRMDLLFERFISRERQEPPDIDIDFEHERREEVIQYIYRRYGRHRAAITAEVICFRRRSALREVGKVFDLPLSAVEAFLTQTHRTQEPDWEAAFQKCPDAPRPLLEHYVRMTQLIRGFPRHIGTHVGGFVLCQDNLTRNVPIENAAMENRTIIQWDKNDLDDLGFVRVDILGLGILTCIRKALSILEPHYGKHWGLRDIPSEDPWVYRAIGRGDTIGVFQIESRAQMNMLPRLRPQNFFDLVVEISIVRPGPIQGDMVHPYLRRRNGDEPVEYAHPKLEAILKKTFGVPLFQEQIMKMAMEVAGFTPGEADALRRSMGTWRKDGSLTHMGNRFRQGLEAQGIDPSFAERIFHQIEGFAEYGFPESHAASFAILAYATAYLKTYYPDVYLTAILNSEPMGFYQSHSLIHDAERHGVKCLPIDLNLSQWDNELEKPGSVRLGFREIKGISKNLIGAVMKARPFVSLDDLATRLRPSGVNKRDLILLGSANALDSIGTSRRQALWEIQSLPIPDSLYMPTTDGVTLPQETSWEKIVLDYETAGVSLFAHPLSFLRQDLETQKVVSSSGIKFMRNKQKVKVAGLVICRQMPPTASGVLFITLEDEFGFLNLVVWNTIYQRYREPLITQSFLFAEGEIQKTEKTNVTHVIVESARPIYLNAQTPPQLPSHDFH